MTKYAVSQGGMYIKAIDMQPLTPNYVLTYDPVEAKLFTMREAAQAVAFLINGEVIPVKVTVAFQER
jgi:hypothetical protein